MTRATLLALAERVEAAVAEDSECVIREASWAVNVMFANRQDLHTRVNVLLNVGAYESAAMALVPSGCRFTVERFDAEASNATVRGQRAAADTPRSP